MPPKKQAKKKVAAKKVTKKVTSKSAPKKSFFESQMSAFNGQIKHDAKVASKSKKEVKRGTKNIKRSVTALKNLATKLSKNKLKTKVAKAQSQPSYSLRKLPIYKNQKTLAQFDHDIEANYNALNKLKKPGEFWTFTFKGNKSFQPYTSIDNAMADLMKYKSSREFGKDSGPEGKKLVDAIRLVKFKGTPKQYRKIKDAEVQARVDKKNAKRDKEKVRRQKEAARKLEDARIKRDLRNENRRLKARLKKSEAKNAKKKVATRKISGKQSKVSKVANKKSVTTKTTTKRAATKKATKVASKKSSNSKSKASKKGKR